MEDKIIEPMPVGKSVDQPWVTVREKQLWLIGLLLAGGLILVCFSQPIGQFFVQKTYFPTGGYSWSLDDAHEKAGAIQILGVLAFLAGLVERVVLCIRYDKGISGTTAAKGYR